MLGKLKDIFCCVQNDEKDQKIKNIISHSSVKPSIRSSRRRQKNQSNIYKNNVILSKFQYILEISLIFGGILFLL